MIIRVPCGTFLLSFKTHTLRIQSQNMSMATLMLSCLRRLPFGERSKETRLFKYSQTRFQTCAWKIFMMSPAVATILLQFVRDSEAFLLIYSVGGGKGFCHYQTFCFLWSIPLPSGYISIEALGCLHSFLIKAGIAVGERAFEAEQYQVPLWRAWGLSGNAVLLKTCLAI